MRVASNRCQCNESAQSNQQDLIGEMETNGQQMPTHDPGLFVQADCQPREAGMGQCCEGCLTRQTEGATNHSARRGQGAFAALALPGPMMRMIASTFRALPLKCRVTMSCRAGILALAAVRIVRAAAHHQVNYQHRDAQDTGQPDHTTSSFTRYPLSAATFRHLQANWPARCPRTIIQSADRKQSPEAFHATCYIRRHRQGSQSGRCVTLSRRRSNDLRLDGEDFHARDIVVYFDL